MAREYHEAEMDIKELVRDWTTDPSVILTSANSFEQDLRDIFYEAHGLLMRKHRDYGPRNISDSPGGPLNGLLVRMWDKMARLRNLVEQGTDPQNESVRDTYLDLANYAIIALMVIDEKWPEK